LTTRDTIVSKTKLLPCPFCAAVASEYSGDSQGFPDKFGVVCTDCGASVEDNENGQQIRKWNDRAVNPDAAALGQAQTDAADRLGDNLLLKEEVYRLGIEHGDMNEANVKYEKRIESLESVLTRIREISVESGAHNTVAFCDLAMKGSQIAAGDTPPKHCEWFEDDDGWHGSCGKYWQFIDDGPKENGVNFCMDCGRPVQLTEFVEISDAG